MSLFYCWKCVSETSGVWNWLQFNVKKTMEKVRGWMSAVEHFRSRLSDGDEVLAAWCRLLSDFYQHLPVLSKLSHKALMVWSFLPEQLSCARKEGQTFLVARLKRCAGAKKCRPGPSQSLAWPGPKPTTVDQYMTGHAWYLGHAPALVAEVTMLLDHVCGMCCRHFCDKTLATDSLSENWKHFSFGVR